MRVLGMFAKQPIPGAVKTRLAAEIGIPNATEFCEAALRDLRDRCAVLGDARTLGYSPDTDTARAYFLNLAASAFDLWPQPAGDLGGRIDAFFNHALAHGPAGDVQAVLIGSDSPNLPTDLINAAFRALENRDVVLGPATDGGYYLIGLRRQVAGWLSNVRWSTAQALRDTVDAATNARLSLGILPPWYDIDTASDLLTLEGHLAALRAANPHVLLTRTEQWLQGWSNPAKTDAPADGVQDAAESS